MRTPYGNRDWIKLRKEIIARHPLCVACLNARRITKAEHVDHIRGFKSRAEFFDRDNLQPLCRSCHSKKTHTAGGPDHLRRAQSKLGPKRFKI